MVQGSWIVAVGDELLSGHTADSNSFWLSRRLRETAYPVRRMVVVGDTVGEIVEVIHQAQEAQIDRIFCCGGLGPTPDDRTMVALGVALDLPLQEDQETLEAIRRHVERMHREGRIASPEPNPGNRKMAMVPAGALVLRNPKGMAPPLAIPLPATAGARWLLVLPGVPRELTAIVEEEMLPVFCRGDGAVVYAEQRYSGVPESQFFPVLTALAEEHPQVRFGSYPQALPGEVVIRACAADAAALELAMAALRERAPLSSS